MFRNSHFLQFVYTSNNIKTLDFRQHHKNKRPWIGLDRACCDARSAKDCPRHKYLKTQFMLLTEADSSEIKANVDLFQSSLLNKTDPESGYHVQTVQTFGFTNIMLK